MMRSMTKTIGKTNANAAMLCVAIGWLAFTVLAGCATTKPADPEVSDHDPFEPVNRKIHRVNDIADNWVAKPVTEAYFRTRHGPSGTAFPISSITWRTPA